MEAALYLGYSDQEHIKEYAMETFERVNYYGFFAGDSLKSLAGNLVTCCQILLYQLDSAACYLRKSLENSEQANSDETRNKVLTNYAILQKLKEEYERSISYLRFIKTENGDKELLYHRNIDDALSSMKKTDSATIHIIRILSLFMIVILSFTLFLYHRILQKGLYRVELNNTPPFKKQEQFQLAEQLTAMQKEKIKIMQKLEVFLKDRRNLSALNDLEQQLFSGQDHWAVMLEMIDMAYPGLHDRINKEYPSMNELEKRVLLLSYFKLSRTDEATLLGISTSVLDKVRGRIRKLKRLDDFEKSLDD